ncbi:MAG: tellurium resistance protein TerC [Chloroflexi bacterium]|nr:tellurium resistance protein TerC [Chloroflexota bacterium]
MFDLSIITIIVQLVFLESILSIDNAAVLGAMAAPLPTNQPVPWPHSLQWLGRAVNGMLGMQREAALKVGLLGAYLGRTAMLFAATFIINNPWLRILGAAYLVYLAIGHIANLDDDQEPAHDKVKIVYHSSFWTTVLSIELADLAFSIDNVVAAVALSTLFWIVVAGVALGILAMRFAASAFARLVSWEPALQTGAYLLVLAIGAELLIKEFTDIHIGEFMQFGISVLILVGTVLVARSPMRNLNSFWRPIIGFFKLIYTPFAAMQQLIHRSA